MLLELNRDYKGEATLFSIKLTDLRRSPTQAKTLGFALFPDTVDRI